MKHPKQGGLMKRLLCFIILSCTVSGCATSTPFVIDNGTRSRVFIPCTTDSLCFRDGYDIVWDNWCPDAVADYPVSYRVKQSEYLSDRVEYILKPRKDAEATTWTGGEQWN
jgi:hypothetical protein